MVDVQGEGRYRSPFLCFLSAYPTIVGSVNSTEPLEGQNALSTLGEDEKPSQFIDADAPEEFLVVYYDELVPMVVEGAKELDKRITDCDAFRRERRREMDAAVREVDELLSRSAPSWICYGRPPGRLIERRVRETPHDTSGDGYKKRRKSRENFNWFFKKK